MEAQKPSILIFSTAYSPFIGGAEVAIREITERNSDFGFHMITAKIRKDLPNLEKVGSIMVHRVGFGIPALDKLLLPFWGAFKTLGLKKSHNVKVYWSMMITYATWAARFANLLSFKKVPLVITLQEGDSEKYLRTKWLGLINLSWRIMLRNAKSVTAISTYLAKRAKSLGYRGEVHIVPNAVDVAKFSMEVSKDIVKNTRDGLGLKAGDVALVTASRLNQKNGIKDVIEAMPLLPAHVKFIIFGEGELRTQLEMLAAAKKVHDRVWFRGFVTHDELPVYLKSCDIFIRASLSEGFGNSFVEAMAARIPVIATPVGGIVDFLHDNETGVFAEVENPESIAKAVKRLVDDPTLTEEIKERAFKMVKEKYDWNIIADEMSKVFKSL